jgi:hypothetical protein
MRSVRVNRATLSRSVTYQSRLGGAMTRSSVILLEGGVDGAGEEVIDVSATAPAGEAARVVVRDETIEEVAHVVSVLKGSKRGVLTTKAVAAVEGDGGDERRLALGKPERGECLDALGEGHRRCLPQRLRPSRWCVYGTRRR